MSTMLIFLFCLVQTLVVCEDNWSLRCTDSNLNFSSFRLCSEMPMFWSQTMPCAWEDNLLSKVSNCNKLSAYTISNNFTTGGEYVRMFFPFPFSLFSRGTVLSEPSIRVTSIDLDLEKLTANEPQKLSYTNFINLCENTIYFIYIKPCRRLRKLAKRRPVSTFDEEKPFLD